MTGRTERWGMKKGQWVREETWLMKGSKCVGNKEKYGLNKTVGKEEVRYRRRRKVVHRKTTDSMPS